MFELSVTLKAHFDGLQDRMAAFCRHGVQLEGWLKGELLTLLDRDQIAGRLRDLDREVKLGGGRIDLLLTMGDSRHWVELKQWLVGEQRGTSWKPANYFNDREIGIVKDVDKLLAAPRVDRCWVLVLCCANPGDDLWGVGVNSFNTKFAPRRVVSAWRPSLFPPSYSLGLLEVVR